MPTSIIFLNGTSSSGKSSIAKKIQEHSNIPFVHLEIDTFLNMILFKHIDCVEIDGVNENCQKLISGFHNCFGAMADAENNIIIDHVLQESSWLVECLTILRNQKVYFIGVHCSIETLKKRELARLDRPIGLAELQYNKVHSQCIYDIDINSEIQSIDYNAQKILSFVESNQKPKAWNQLCQKYNLI